MGPCARGYRSRTVDNGVGLADPWIAYVLLAIGLLGSGHSRITHWGGYVTIACAVIAWYTAVAAVINGTLRRTVIPVVPLMQ